MVKNLKTEKKLTQPFLDLKVVLKCGLVGDLVLLFNEVQPFRYNGIVFVLVFADLHEHFDHVLHTVADRALVKDSTKALKD